MRRTAERWVDVDEEWKGFVTEEQVRTFVWVTYVDDDETVEEMPELLPEELEGQVETLMLCAGKKSFMTFWDFANFNASALGVSYILQPLSA